MSKKKKKEKLLKQIQTKKKRVLKKIESEIDSLEYSIKNADATNKKRKIVKNLKISGRFMQLVAPYILTAGILAGSCKLIGVGFPFYSGDKHKTNLKIMKEFDNLDNIRYEKQYDDFKVGNNVLLYHTKWEKDNDGLYKREIEVYDLKKVTEAEVLGLFDKTDIKLQDLFGDPISRKIEIKNNVTKEELNAKEYLKAVIYSIDKNDYIFVKESIDVNLTFTLVYILVTVLSELGIWRARDKITGFSFNYHVEQLNSKYKNVDKKDLIKKLEIKRNDYNRLKK